jgi:hypothetical protein
VSEPSALGRCAPGQPAQLVRLAEGVPGVTMLTVVDEKKRRAYDVGRAIRGTSGAGVTASAGLFCGFRALAARSTFV